LTPPPFPSPTHNYVLWRAAQNEQSHIEQHPHVLQEKVKLNEHGMLFGVSIRTLSSRKARFNEHAMLIGVGISTNLPNGRHFNTSS
jgi:hypothetical protein